MQYGEQRRFNNFHKACGAKFSVFATLVKTDIKPFMQWRDNDRNFALARDGSYRLEYLCTCGKLQYARPVIGKPSPNPSECNDKCMAAIGHMCDCKCRGKNHGASHGG
jgi:hypothetical protein